MNTDLHFSSKSVEWRTPPELYKYLDREFHFVWDVACTSANCLALFGMYYDYGIDALKADWSDDSKYNGLPKTCFMNPPYSRQVGKWVKKAYDESENGVTTVCLLPARPDTKWFQEYCSKGDIWFMEGRIKFIHPNGIIPMPPAPFPSCIVTFSPDMIPNVMFWKKEHQSWRY